ncbi:MAG: MFS transporter [Rhodospirillales bacterium]|nr:MFS transporter [Rhodospirillales bacterium]
MLWRFFLCSRGIRPFLACLVESQRANAEEIGTLLAVGLVLKALIVPLITQYADKRGDRKSVVLVLLLAGLSIFSLFQFTDAFWTIVVVLLLYSSAWSSVMPLGEGLALVEAKKHGLDYGRIRLWGSASFILGSVGGGWLLTGRSEDIIYWVVLGCIGSTVLMGLFLPREQTKTKQKEKSPLRELLTDPPFMICVTAATLIQASHMVYYAFSTLYWREVGHSEAVIGLLWGEGVMAEIILFAFGAAFVRRMGPARLLMIAGIAGLARWSLLASFTSLEVLIVAQLLHAFTFGITHLAFIDYVMHRIPERSSATAIGVYTATAFGIGSGVSMFAAGYLFENLGGNAFWVMAAVSGMGLLSALALKIINKSN